MIRINWKKASYLLAFFCFVFYFSSVESLQESILLRPFYFVTKNAQIAFHKLSSNIDQTVLMYVDLIDIKTENKRIQNENLELKTQLGKFTELEKENERLNRLLEFKEKTDMVLLAAKVIGKDLMPDQMTITINRGSDEGVEEGMGVISQGSVVGYILYVFENHSTVLLATDRYFAVDAIAQKSRAKGIVEGDGKDSCLFKYSKEKLDEGDFVVTSGLDKKFPKGFPIGTIKNIKESFYGLKQVVKVEPLLKESHLEEIFIILNSESRERR